VNGGIGIGADDVSVQNFIIDATTSIYPVGIGATRELHRVEVKQNTVVGSTHIGIFFNYGKDLNIFKNNVSGSMDYGILLDAFEVSGFPSDFTENTSRGNTIFGNTVSGIRAGFGFGFGYGIWLRRRSIGNVVKGNTVSDCIGGIDMEGEGSTDNLIANNIISDTGPFAAIELRADCDRNTIHSNEITNSRRGIYIWSSAPNYYPPAGDWSCDYNIIKNNTVKNCFDAGLGLVNGGTYNEVGPGNVFNENSYGIGLVGASFTSIFNNKALNNRTCDIVNFSGINGNTLKNNHANCVQGF
jgi:parallel beta-helix repeat protein